MKDGRVITEKWGKENRRVNNKKYTIAGKGEYFYHDTICIARII